MRASTAASERAMLAQQRLDQAEAAASAAHQTWLLADGGDAERDARALVRARSVVAAAARQTVRADGTHQDCGITDPRTLKGAARLAQVTAPGYEITWHREWSFSGSGVVEFGTVSRRQARRYLAARGADGFRLLRDLSGTFYAVSAASWYRLRTTAAPAPTEAHVLHAALRAYGVTGSFTNSGGGTHYVVVPLGPVPDEPLDGCHISIAAGEHTQRYPQDHEETFTAWLCDDAGNPIGEPLYLGFGADCATDAALCAKAVAGWLARH